MTKSEKEYGVTEKQLLDAPLKSIYIVPHYHLIPYMRDLAQHHGRTDLEFAVPRYLGRSVSTIVARSRSVIIDHATWTHIAGIGGGDRREFMRGMSILIDRGLVDETAQHEMARWKT